jgi:hypothetical protein
MTSGKVSGGRTKMMTTFIDRNQQPHIVDPTSGGRLAAIVEAARGAV